MMIDRLFNYMNVGLSKRRAIVKWSQKNTTAKNIGDALNPYLFEKVFDKIPVNSSSVVNLGFLPVYSFIGSVLDASRIKNLTVLGSGFKRADSKIFVPPTRVFACRGPLTAAKLKESGAKFPEVFGDPAILLPFYFNPTIEKKFKLGIIPHYVDKTSELIEKFKNDPEVKILDVFSPMEEFISDIKSCEFTVSSSLHGIILSHAYGIPSGWLKLSNKLAGGKFKFDDYYMSLKFTAKPIELNNFSTVKSIEKEVELIDTEGLAHGLLESFKNLY